MKKKPLIGISICAVVLLVLGSLSNVVGYTSMKSSVVNDSPLFQTRTQRATNQQKNSITSQYLGMGKHNLLQFPIRENTTEQQRKAIEIISKMDDKTFEWFTELCIQKARQNDTLQDLSHYQIIQALLLLKTNPDAIINSYTIWNNQELPGTMFTYCGTYTTCGSMFPGCWILCILYYILSIPIIIIWTILGTILDLLTISGSYYCKNPS